MKHLLVRLKFFKSAGMTNSEKNKETKAEEQFCYAQWLRDNGTGKDKQYYDAALVAAEYTLGHIKFDHPVFADADAG